MRNLKSVDSIVDETGVTAPGRAGYPVDVTWFDEAFEADGQPRPLYRPLIEALGALDLEELRASVLAATADRGVGFRTPQGESPFIVDPVPRLIGAEEWAIIAEGAAQRLRALNAFLADIYGGESRIVEDGVVPERVITSSEQFERSLVGVDPPPLAHVAGLDLVRDSDGRFAVLEDNLRSPSGITYAMAAREAVTPRLPGISPDNDPAAAILLLAKTLRAAAPAGAEGGAMVVLSDGPGSAAYFEHRQLALMLGAALATPAELEATDGGIALCDEEGGKRRVGVVYRRTDEDRLTAPDGSPTSLGELLLPAIRGGRLASVNAFGTGLADDKLVHAYVEAMIGYYLGEEPILPSVETFDLGDQGQRSRALNRLDQMVVKPRGGLGGRGVIILARASTAQARRVQALLAREPGKLVAQEMVRISRHPTVVDGALSPRHVDLRPYAFTIGDRVEVAPLALTRYARQAESMIVNSSKGGGGKDTWIVAR